MIYSNSCYLCSIFGGQGIGLRNGQLIDVKAFLVRDIHLKDVMTSQDLPPKSFITIKNAEQQLKFSQKVNKCWGQASFNALELHSAPKKDERKENELVTDIKYAIVFVTNVTLRNKSYTLKVSLSYSCFFVCLYVKMTYSLSFSVQKFNCSMCIKDLHCVMQVIVKFFSDYLSNVIF